jgi:hypothetical protein
MIDSSFGNRTFSERNDIGPPATDHTPRRVSPPVPASWRPESQSDSPVSGESYRATVTHLPLPWKRASLALVALKHPPHSMGASLPFDGRMADVWQILRGISPEMPRRSAESSTRPRLNARLQSAQPDAELTRT